MQTLEVFIISVKRAVFWKYDTLVVVKSIYSGKKPDVGSQVVLSFRAQLDLRLFVQFFYLRNFLSSVHRITQVLEKLISNLSYRLKKLGAGRSQHFFLVKASLKQRH